MQISILNVRKPKKAYKGMQLKKSHITAVQLHYAFNF